MAILGQKDSEIEVRLQKLPINNEHNSKAYLDEYAPVGKKDKSTKSVSRFILPGECTYAIEITLKKGFIIGDGGLAVRLWDKRSSKLFHERTLFCSLPHGGQKTLNTDKKYFVKSIPEWLNAEEGKDDSPITFYVLRPDKPLIEASKVSSHVGKTVESLEVELIRYSAPRQDRIYEARSEEVEFGQRMKRYELLRKVIRSNVQVQGRPDQAVSIGRERHVNYSSVTPATRLIGSAEAGSLLKPPERYHASESIKHMRFTFFVRTAKFMDRHGLAKTTIPQELQELQHWDTLNDAQRKACFKLLQEADKKLTEQQKYKEADARTEREKNEIYKLLFNVGISPDRWRPFDILYVRERRLLFEELQTRRKFFDRGESPPEHAMTKPSPRTSPSNGRSSNANSSSAASVFSSNTPTRNPQPSAPVILINEDHDDDDPDDEIPLSTRRGFLKYMGPSSIKSGPAETALRRSVIDVDAYPDLDEQHPRRAVASPYNVDDTSPSKRVKLELGDSPRTPVDENAELRRLMEQSRRDEELLRQEQRVAERMRILNETRARIAELKARKSGNDGSE